MDAKQLETQPLSTNKIAGAESAAKTLPTFSNLESTTNGDENMSIDNKIDAGKTMTYYVLVDWSGAEYVGGCTEKPQHFTLGPFRTRGEANEALRRDVNIRKQ